jgi:hypothetical protein
MKNIYKPSFLFFVTVIILFFSACNDDEDTTENNDLPHPVGVADYGNSDSYEIYGIVADEQGNPVPNMLINVQTDKVFVGEIMVYSGSDGRYRFTGLPAWSTDIGLYDLIVQTDSDWSTYERVLYWLLQSSQADNTLTAIEQDITVRKVVSGTQLTGTILDTENNPIAQSDLLLINLDIGTNRQGPAFNLNQLGDGNEYFNYDQATGTFTFMNCLAGGNYALHLNASGYNWDQEGATISVTPGETTTFNIVLSQE